MALPLSAATAAGWTMRTRRTAQQCGRGGVRPDRIAALCHPRLGCGGGVWGVGWAQCPYIAQGNRKASFYGGKIIAIII